MKIMWLLAGSRGIIWLIVNFSKVSYGYSFGETFDFIVVGGGVGGCTVASRLSENGRFSVLLLEAGDFPNPGVEIPGLYTTYVNSGNLKTYFLQPGADAGGRIIEYQVGRVLGGGSCVNGMAFNRGNPNDWDNWANLTDDPTWKYENMLKYFKRVETYMGDFPSDQHGYSGPITVSRPKYTPGLETYLQAGVDLGYPVADPNGPQKMSFTPLEFSIRRGRRVSAYIGYIRPYLGTRKNLKVVVKAKVERILFQLKNDTISATGVVYSTPSPGGKESILVRASKEVIVSAGVMESPTLLLRSGIGSKIPGTPLPGKNLHDHLLVKLVFMHNDSSQVLLPERDFTPENFQIYNETGEGPYSTPDGTNAQAFLKSSFEPVVNWPDLHGIFVSSGLSVAVPEDIREGEYVVFSRVYITRPRSRGRVYLNATEPEGDPTVDMQYLQNPQDMGACQG